MTLDYITLTPEELGKLLSAGSGEAALVYLYMKSTGDVTLKQAEQQLNMPMQNLGWAESLLKRLGLMDAVVPKARFDRQQAPVYTGEEVTAFSARDPGFQLLQGEVSRRMGRVLTTAELKTLLSLRDYLKLPPEVISMALTFCLQRLEYYNKSAGRNRTSRSSIAPNMPCAAVCPCPMTMPAVCISAAKRIMHTALSPQTLRFCLRRVFFRTRFLTSSTRLPVSYISFEASFLICLKLSLKNPFTYIGT